MTKWTGFDRQWLWMNWDTIPAFAWRDWRKSQKICHDNPRPSRAPPENNQPTQYTHLSGAHLRIFTITDRTLIKWVAFLIRIRKVRSRSTYLDPETNYHHFVFRRVCNIAKKRLLASSCLSVCMKQLVSHWTDFHEIWYRSIFRKSVMEIQVSLKSDSNNGYFTWRPKYIYGNISPNSS